MFEGKFFANLKNRKLQEMYILGYRDWHIQENANTQKSVNGLNNYVRETFTKKYWLYEIYPIEVREAHESGDCHIHDLGFFGPYCAGWDLRHPGQKRGVSCTNIIICSSIGPA